MALHDAKAPEAEPSERIWQRALLWLRARDLDELLLVVSLIATCVLVRLLWLLPVDVYWDAACKWHFARQWSYANDFSDQPWNHHMARFGVNVPAYFVQKVFGTVARVYYIIPIAAHTLQMLFVYLLGRRLAGRAAGLLGALLMIFLTGMTRNASQLLPDGIVGTTALMAGYAFVRFHEAQGKWRSYWLLAVGLGCIWCYAIKESSVLLFPGFALAVLLSRRSFKEAAIFCGMLAGYGALETLGFRLFTNYPHRLAIVRQGHEPYPPIGFLELFERFTRLDPSWQMLFWLWVVSVFYDLGSSDRRRRLLLLLPVSYVFFLTFMVRSINPIQQWLSSKPRYMSPVGGFFALGIGLFAYDALARAWALWNSSTPRRVRAWLTQNLALLTCSFCVVVGGIMYRSERPHFGGHPLTILRRDASILNDAFRRNLPIVEDYSKPRGLYTIYGVYLQPQYLAQSDVAKDGILPDIKAGVRRSKRGKKYAYVLRDASAYRRNQMDKLVKAGCGVVIKTRRHVTLNVHKKLPERCKAPRGKPIPN